MWLRNGLFHTRNMSFLIIKIQNKFNNLVIACIMYFINFHLIVKPMIKKLFFNKLTYKINITLTSNNEF